MFVDILPLFSLLSFAQEAVEYKGGEDGEQQEEGDLRVDVQHVVQRMVDWNEHENATRHTQ